jgi:hypothetical protein
VLSNFSILQTFTLLHREEFSKSCTSNISEVLLQNLKETLICQVTQAYTRLFSTYSTHIWKWKVSYGPPWAHYLGGYKDRLLGGPLGGLPDLRCTAPAGVKHKDYRGEVLG